MLKTMIRAALFAAACGLSFAALARADEAKRLDIPAGDLTAALQQLSEQSGVELIYQSDQIRGLHTGGVVGEMTAQDAVTKLLNGTPLMLKRDESGAMVIVAPGVSATTSLNSGVKSPRPGADRLRGPGAEGAGTSVALAQADDRPSTKGLAVGGQSGSEVKATAEGETNSTATRLEEILVTAQKREERLQDVPISIAVITNQEIERRGLIAMEDYLRSIPGVNQVDRGIDTSIVIRGITVSAQGENFASGTTVASYFDETPITGTVGMGAGGGVDLVPVDIDRIEVLRGPQGTAYGSASLAGALRMIPAKPKLDKFSAKVSGSYSETSGFGSDNSMVQAILNVPVVADRFAVRAVGYRYDESGFYRNVAGIDPTTIAWAESFGLGDFVRGPVQNDIGRMVITGGRFAALWDATDNLSLSLNFLTQDTEQDGSPEAGVGAFEQARTPIDPDTRIRGEAGEVNDSNMDLTNLVLNYDMGWGVLTSAASWVDSGAAYATGGLFAPATSFLGPITSTGKMAFESFTSETRVASQLRGRFQFLGGLFYEDVEDDYVTPTTWPDATSPYGPDPIFRFTSTRKLDQRAVFGEMSYDLTEKLTATAGGRYFQYEKDETTLTDGTFGSGVVQFLNSDESGSSLKAGVDYKPTPDSLWYASWSEGFRLGRPDIGGNPQFCDPDGNGIIDPLGISMESTRHIDSDFLESYEVGGKFTLFDGRMVIDTAIYHIQWQGLPAQVITEIVGCTYTANAGAANSDGAEFQTSLQMTEGLRLDFGVGYTRARLTENVPGLPGGVDGARLPGAPETSANFAAQYDFDVAGHKAFVRADSFYTGEFYGDLGSTPGTRSGDYVKIDARAGMTFSRLNFELFVHNLTNEDAFTYRGLNTLNGPLYGYRLRPRTVGIQLEYTFE